MTILGGGRPLARVSARRRVVSTRITVAWAGSPMSWARYSVGVNTIWELDGTTFAAAARNDGAFARELPRCLAAVCRVFNQYELIGYVATQKPAVRKELRALLYL